jgi:hypothetical protein
MNSGIEFRSRTVHVSGRRLAAWKVCAVLLLALACQGNAHAQGFGGGGGGMGGGFGFGGAVGGISIDADGIVRNLDPHAIESLAKERRQMLAGDAADRGPAAKLRKVSLAKIIAAVKASAAGRPLPPDVLFLGGLERITHVFVDTEGHDIVLAGPADALTVDASGNVVGARSGRPLLQLEDLVVAMRSIDAARAGGIKCSIDPTAEGVVRLKALLRTQKMIGPNPDATLVAMQNAMGPQQVTVGGVPGDSRFARVLVAADYHLKRVGMGLEPSGTPELPSYLSMATPNSASSTTLPRFWLEADYEPISRDPDELAWRINGRRMKCLTENDIFDANGARTANAAVDPAAKRWCDLMTKNYDRVAGKQPAFAELVNCVDLGVVAALVHGRQLAERAELDLTPLLEAQALPLPSYAVPKSLPTVAHGIKKGSRWVVSASGGVLFQPWSFAANSVDSTDMAESRTVALAARPADGWWWD